MANRRKKTPASSTPSAQASAENQSAVPRQSTVPRDDRVSDEEIRARAYELYLERGAENGNDIEDWLRAENEYRQRSQRRPGDVSREELR